MPESPRRLTSTLVVAIIVLAAAVSAGAWLRGRQPWPADEKARESWQRVGDIVQRLEIGEGNAVADIGAGGGFFTVRLAAIVGPQGHVYAVDVDERTVRELQERIAREGQTNVDVIRGEEDDPKLPADTLDAVLIVNAYHEMREHQEILAAIHRALKPDGRLVLVEPAPSGSDAGSRKSQMNGHVIAIELVEDDLRTAGFEVLERQEAFAHRPTQKNEWMMVAKKRS